MTVLAYHTPHFYTMQTKNFINVLFFIIHLLVRGQENIAISDHGTHSLGSPQSIVLSEIEELLNQAKTKEAMHVMETVHTDDLGEKEKIQMQILQARAYVQSGAAKEGESLLKKVTESFPSHIDANFLLGKLYVQQKEWNKAEERLVRVLGEDSEHDKSMVLLSKVYLGRDENAAAAKAILHRALIAKPFDATIYFELGMIAFQYDDDHSTAREEFLRAEQLNKDINRKIFARVYMYYKHFDWAAQEFEKVTINFVFMLVT